jgi:hypothetical protein
MTIWRPVGGSRKITLIARPMEGWERPAGEGAAWDTNCLSIPVFMEWELKG